MHMFKYMAIYLYRFPIWALSVAQPCGLLCGGVGGRPGGKWNGGGQDASGEISPPCLLTVATVLGRIRSAAGEDHASLSPITRELTGRQTSHFTPTLHVPGCKRRLGLHFFFSEYPRSSSAIWMTADISQLMSAASVILFRFFNSIFSLALKCALYPQSLHLLLSPHSRLLTSRPLSPQP